MAERWLADRTKPTPPKPRIICRFTGTKPNLDGKLDETFWQAEPAGASADVRRFRKPQLKSEVHFAHDEEYLYLAVRCEKIPTLSYATENRARSYDRT